MFGVFELLITNFIFCKKTQILTKKLIIKIEKV